MSRCDANMDFSLNYVSKDIKKRWQEYTEELYKKDLYDLDNHDGVITYTH